MQSLQGISSSSEAEELGGNRSGSPGVKGLFDEVIRDAACSCCYQVASGRINRSSTLYCSGTAQQNIKASKSFFANRPGRVLWVSTRKTHIFKSEEETNKNKEM